MNLFVFGELAFLFEISITNRANIGFLASMYSKMVFEVASLCKGLETASTVRYGVLSLGRRVVILLLEDLASINNSLYHSEFGITESELSS
jgi:hypothetical protein